MSERIEFAIPFEGFYQTDLDEDLDNHIFSLWDDQQVEKVDWKATHARVAEQYAIEWLELRNLQSGRFEKYLPPSIFKPLHLLKVSVDLTELHVAYAEILSESGKPTTQVEWETLEPEYAWEDAWLYLEQEVEEEQIIPHSIRMALKNKGFMDPIFKE